MMLVYLQLLKSDDSIDGQGGGCIRLVNENRKQGRIHYTVYSIHVRDGEVEVEAGSGGMKPAF